MRTSTIETFNVADGKRNGSVSSRTHFHRPSVCADADDDLKESKRKSN